MTGRPTKCTPATVKALCSMVKKGLPDSWAAEALGLARSTVAEWKVKGEAGEQPYRDFLDAYTRARHERRVVLLERVMEAAETDWKAAKWYLERVERDEFGAKPEPQVVEVHSAPASPAISPEDAKAKLRAITGGK